MITIGIPTYERMTYIRNAIDSCLKQTHSDFEILINDSSEHHKIEELVTSLRSYKIRYIRNPNSMRITAKLNQLVEEARGDWMIILCDDDSLEPNYLESMVDKLQAWPNATLFRSRYRLIDETGNLIRLDQDSKKFMSPAEFLSRVFLKEKDFFKMNISGIMFPRKLLIELGGFPELPIPWHTDRLTWSMLATQGGCVFESEPLCNIRLHSGSITSSFGKDLTSSLESDMLAKRQFEDLIDQVGDRDLSEEDLEYWFQAKENLRNYMLRHLSRSLDHAFLTYLSDQKQWSANQLKSLFNKVNEMKVGTFPSLIFYNFVSLLPSQLRNPLLQAFKYYKVRKWCS